MLAGLLRFAAGAQRFAPPGKSHRLHVRAAHFVAQTVFHFYGLGDQSPAVKFFPVLKGCRIHPDGFQSNHPHPPKSKPIFLYFWKRFPPSCLSSGRNSEKTNVFSFSAQTDHRNGNQANGRKTRAPPGLLIVKRQAACPAHAADDVRWVRRKTFVLRDGFPQAQLLPRSLALSMVDVSSRAAFHAVPVCVFRRLTKEFPKIRIF